ncbi:hypothetical protein GCM10018789_60600 [Streptomyces werraensis]|nr:hypothetical protein GCM10018789_60600 [Streptomyces werraensis]
MIRLFKFDYTHSSRNWAVCQKAGGAVHGRDGHVDPEDPLPAEAVGDRAAHDRSEGDGRAADGRPQSEGQAA